MTLKIECPSCGTQYLPGEIYIPKYFLGQPEKVEKDCYGKIVDFGGIGQELSEEYVCDKCGKKFRVIANIRFNVQPVQIEEEYVTKIKRAKLTLTE